jgi:hypothetical protein
MRLAADLIRGTTTSMNGMGRFRSTSGAEGENIGR